MAHQRDVLMRGYRPVQELRGVVLEKSAGAEPPARSTISRPANGTASRSRSRSTRPFPAASRNTTSRTYRYSYQSLVTPSSVFDYDTADRQIDAAEAAGSAGRLRSHAVRVGAAVGHGARWREGAALDRLQEGLQARRQGAAVPVRLRLLWHSACRRRSPARG